MRRDRLIFQGELIETRSLLARGLAVLAIPLAWLMFFLVVPSVLVAMIGFLQRNADGTIEWNLTLENFRRLLGFGTFGWSADYLRILGRTAWMALVTTILSLLFAYPLAFFIAERPPRTRYLWLAVTAIPLCTNLVIRTSAWMLLLDHRLPLARIARALGLIPENSALYPGPFAVYIGMLSYSLPFAVLPIYASVERMDWTLVEAARDLYASRPRIFRHAILPQTLPGLIASIILTFVPAIGIFVVPDLLGGSKTMLVGNLIQQQFGPSRDWPFGSAISLGVMVLTLMGLFILGRANQRKEQTP